MLFFTSNEERDVLTLSFSQDTACRNPPAISEAVREANTASWDQCRSRLQCVTRHTHLT
jgi:hypothetical protein